MNPLESFQTRFCQLAMASPDALAQQLTGPLSVPEDPEDSTLALFQQQPVERLAQYQWMVYANHADTLETIYPYCYRLLQPQWEALVQGYLERFPPRGYQLYDMAVSFPEFLADESDRLAAYPFLAELAEYELLEATLLRFAEPEGEPIRTKVSAFPLTGESLGHLTPLVNPVAQAFTSSYPLDEIVARLQETAEDAELPELPVETERPLFLWVYRDKDFNCRFFKVSPFIQSFLTACLLVQSTEPVSYATVLKNTCAAYAMELTPAMMADMAGFLPQLVEKDILWGSADLSAAHR